MTPVIPHLTNECFDKLNHNKKLDWPKVKEEYLGLNEKLIVIQINGKKRNTITIKDEINEENLMNKIKEMKLVEKYITSKEVQKIIYIKNKLINIIVK